MRKAREKMSELISIVKRSSRRVHHIEDRNGLRRIGEVRVLFFLMIMDVASKKIGNFSEVFVLFGLLYILKLIYTGEFHLSSMKWIVVTSMLFSIFSSVMFRGASSVGPQIKFLISVTLIAIFTHQLVSFRLVLLAESLRLIYSLIIMNGVSASYLDMRVFTVSALLIDSAFVLILGLAGRNPLAAALGAFSYILGYSIYQGQSSSLYAIIVFTFLTCLRLVISKLSKAKVLMMITILVLVFLFSISLPLPFVAFLGGELSRSGRIDIWRDAIASLRQQPLSVLFGGAHLQNYFFDSDSRHAHNDFLEGIIRIGLVPTMLMYFWLFSTILSDFRSKNFTRAYLRFSLMIIAMGQSSTFVMADMSRLLVFLGIPIGLKIESKKPFNDSAVLVKHDAVR